MRLYACLSSRVGTCEGSFGLKHPLRMEAIMTTRHVDFLNSFTDSLPNNLRSQCFSYWRNNPEKLRLALRKIFNLSLHTVELGTAPESTDELISQVRNAGNTLSRPSLLLMRNSEFEFPTPSRRVNLVILSVGSLGFEKGASYFQIIESAKSLGLKLCPLEAAPRLCLAYSNQPEGEHLTIAHSPALPSDRFSSPHLFFLSRDPADRWFGAEPVPACKTWSPDSQFVFVLS